MTPSKNWTFDLTPPSTMNFLPGTASLAEMLDSESHLGLTHYLSIFTLSTFE
jgi:hypothetical protein